VSERHEPSDPPLDPPPSPTDYTLVECADNKSPSQPVPKEPPVDSPAIEDSRNESISAPRKMIQAAAAVVIGFSRLSVEPPSAVAVAEQELQAASPTTVATLAASCFRPALMIKILVNPVIPSLAPPLAAEADEIPVVMVSQGTLDRGRRTQAGTTSRPTISLSLWLVLLFSSSVHGITLNCTNKNTPSSSCCAGEITLDPTMTIIAANAFDGCSGLTGSLTLPSSVTTIGGWAFFGCGFTGSLTIPSSVTTISIAAFYGCSGFTGSLTIPSSVTTIGDYAFYQCYGFTGSLTLPSSVTTIGTSAFYQCYGFTGSLTLPSSVTTIGNSAFQSCTGFTSAVTFPNSVTTLGTSPFASNKCDWLSCCSSCTLPGAQMCLCSSPSCSGVCPSFAPSTSPSFAPSTSPSFAPSTSPSFAPSTSPSFAPSASPFSAIVFGFGVKFGDQRILGSGKAILVDYLRDTKRGCTFP
jgi:hypothetical protein